MSELKLREALLPCPFCGGAPDIEPNGIGDFFVVCENCGARSSDVRCESEEHATDLWNRRFISAQPTSDGESAPLTDAIYDEFAEVLQKVRPAAEINPVIAYRHIVKFIKQSKEHARQLERTLHAKERELAAARSDRDDWMLKATYRDEPVPAAPQVNDTAKTLREWADKELFGTNVNRESHLGYIAAREIERLRALPSGYVQVPRETTECSSYDHCPKQDDGTHCVHWWDGEACCSCGDKGTEGIVREWLQQVGDDGYRQDGERAAAWCLLKMLPPPTPSDSKPGEGT